MLKWLLNNQKSIAICIFVTLVLLLVWNLWTMINHLDMSYMYTHSLESNSTDTLDMAQQWAIRGQMGDILSGHFSALAFLAVALSVFLQNEANRQMKLSLVQQGKALEVQSKSLEAQLEELQQSRKESEKQTQEFYINNLNSKFDRYFSQIDKKIQSFDINSFENYTKIHAKEFQNLLKSEVNIVDICEIQYYQLFDILETAYEEIEAIKEHNESLYQKFLKEFVTNISNIQMIIALKGFYRDAHTFSVTKLIDAKAFQKIFDKVEEKEQT